MTTDLPYPPRDGTVLGIDTSVDVQTGLARDGVPRIGMGHPDRRAHAERLMPSVESMLAGIGVSTTAITSVAVGLGPGPFTGLRVGIATAQLYALALGVPWAGACSLDVLAGQLVRDGSAPGGDFVMITDARRREVYWARYDAAGVRRGEPTVGAPADLPDLPITGPGVEPYADLLGSRAIPGPTEVEAAVLAAWQFPSPGVEPLYLRRPDATEPGQRKSALPRVLPRADRRRSRDAS